MESGRARQDIRKRVARLALMRLAWGMFHRLTKPRRVWHNLLLLIPRWREWEKRPVFSLCGRLGTPVCVQARSRLPPVWAEVSVVPREGSCSSRRTEYSSQDPMAVW